MHLSCGRGSLCVSPDTSRRPTCLTFLPPLDGVAPSVPSYGLLRMNTRVVSIVVTAAANRYSEHLPRVHSAMLSLVDGTFSPTEAQSSGSPRPAQKGAELGGAASLCASRLSTSVTVSSSKPLLVYYRKCRKIITVDLSMQKAAVCGQCCCWQELVCV